MPFTPSAPVHIQIGREDWSYSTQRGRHGPALVREAEHLILVPAGDEGLAALAEAVSVISAQLPASRALQPGRRLAYGPCVPLPCAASAQAAGLRPRPGVMFAYVQSSRPGAPTARPLRHPPGRN